MKSLDDILKTVESPNPSDLLKARILKEAKAQRSSETPPMAANDNHWKKWAAIAATVLVVGVLGVTSLSPNSESAEAELWAEKAEFMGYEDLYAWVNDEELVEEQEQSSLKQNSIPT
jgi:hypothetical protein